MTEMMPIADEAATRLAFSLMRSAYLDLAHTLRSIDEGPARDLLQAVEYRIEYRLGSSAQDASDESPQESAIAVAAGRVRSVLREALEN
ncbi:hypothetical protein [Methylobacterium sp. NEAU K]|uniref:hypothetical protein n=1 Tax=Methylobacterium sp. NEAU K TaxID=3064946 RepID=UPI002734CB57|nr:hypothetical protein [Methylobacterium sp. NEAU K]MDP4002159.1 hypothetical protein [Methylobacterium sp. NEAU K]